MAFRLQSILSGAAKRGSERLKTLEEDTNRLITTEASRVAKEMEDTRKARIAAKLDYGKAGRKLRSQYGLNDSQIEAVLAGGLEGVEALDKTMQNAALRAQLGGKVFDRDATLASVLPEISPAIAGRDLETQQEAYAAAMSPFSGTTLDASTSKISESVATRSPFGAPTDYISKRLAAETQAMGGQAPAEFAGQQFGEATGYGFRPDVVSQADILAAQQTAANIKGTEAGTGLKAAQTEQITTMLPAELADKKAATQARLAAAGLDEARTTSIMETLPLDKLKTQAEVDMIAANIKKVDATINQMAAENEQIKANTGLINQRMSKLAIETNILDELGTQEMEAKILQMNTASGLNAIRQETLEEELQFIAPKAKADIERITAAIGTEKLTQEKLQADINLLNTYGAKEKEAGLALIQSKIVANGSYDDLEEFQVALLNENKQLQDQIAATSDASIISELEAQIARNTSFIASSATSLAEGTDAADFFSKANESTIFNNMLETSLQGFDVDFQRSELGVAIASIDAGSRPKYFKAATQAAQEFENLYGSSARGKNFAQRKLYNINQQIKDMAMSTDAKGQKQTPYLGRLTLEQIGNLQDVKEGSTVSYIDPTTQEEMFGVYTAGDFVVPLAQGQ